MVGEIVSPAARPLHDPLQVSPKMLQLRPARPRAVGRRCRDAAVAVDVVGGAAVAVSQQARGDAANRVAVVDVTPEARGLEGGQGFGKAGVTDPRNAETVDLGPGQEDAGQKGQDSAQGMTANQQRTPVGLAVMRSSAGQAAWKARAIPSWTLPGPIQWARRLRRLVRQARRSSLPRKASTRKSCPSAKKAWGIAIVVGPAGQPEADLIQLTLKALPPAGVGQVGKARHLRGKGLAAFRNMAKEAPCATGRKERGQGRSIGHGGRLSARAALKSAVGALRLPETGHWYQSFRSFKRLARRLSVL